MIDTTDMSSTTRKESRLVQVSGAQKFMDPTQTIGNQLRKWKEQQGAGTQDDLALVGHYTGALQG